MTGVTINVPVIETEFIGIAFNVYAEHYRKAATECHLFTKSLPGFDPVPYQLIGQSLELHLKSFIWLKDGIGILTIKKKYGHNLEKLWDDAKERGIGRYVAVTKLRDRCISIVNQYYKSRKFIYLDLDMLIDGYKEIEDNPKIFSILNRLTTHLGRKLENPINNAS